MSPSPTNFSAAVEGPTDEAVLRRVVEHLGASLGPVYGETGKNTLLRQLHGYNQAAQFSPWIVLVDLDQGFECAPPAREQWLPSPAPQMCLRIAVREVESWLMADRERLSEFLGIAVARVPATPESLENPKATLVGLARGSRRHGIRMDMVPRPESGRPEGPAYASRLIEFAQGPWRPDIAAAHADSLQRLCPRVAELIEKANK